MFANVCRLSLIARHFLSFFRVRSYFKPLMDHFSQRFTFSLMNSHDHLLSLYLCTSPNLLIYLPNLFIRKIPVLDLESCFLKDVYVQLISFKILATYCKISFNSTADFIVPVPFLLYPSVHYRLCINLIHLFNLIVNRFEFLNHYIGLLIANFRWLLIIKMDTTWTN